MKRINLFASLSFLVGLAIYMIMTFVFGSFSEGASYFAIWFGWPLMLIGVILFIISFISWIIKRKQSS